MFSCKELVGSGVGQKEAYETIKEIGNIKETETETKSELQRQALRDVDLSSESKRVIYSCLFGDKQKDGSYISSRDDDILAFEEAGLDMDDFLDVQNEYSRIRDIEGGAGDHALEFARFVNTSGYTDEQKAVIKDRFVYYSQIPASASQYDEFVEAGFSDEDAYEIVNILDELPEGAKSLDKYLAIAHQPFSEEEKRVALSTMMPESSYDKYCAASKAGVSTYNYFSFLSEISRYTGEGRQKKIWNYINSMSISRTQKDALHIAAGYSKTSLKNAPWH